MATRPPINSRSAPIDNIARNSARNATIGNAAQSSSASTTGSTATKNKIAFINGAIRKSSRDDLEKYLVWEMCNNMVVSWIVCTLSPTIRRSVLWINTTYGIWDDLKLRFSQQDLFPITEIKCKIYQTKQAYATTVNPKSKLDARVKKCVFLGYVTATKGYKVYDLASKELSVSKDVVFCEHIFPFQQDTGQEGRTPQIILPTMNGAPIEVFEAPRLQNQVSNNDEQTCEQVSLTEYIDL
nr:uncharacterized protein LOC109166622 [Ipomoea batatas]